VLYPLAIKKGNHAEMQKLRNLNAQMQRNMLEDAGRQGIGRHNVKA
jgi:hypothetical protein